MKTADQCTSIFEIRKEIDTIDEEIVSLIAQRSTYVKRAALFKKNHRAVKDPQRVEQVIQSKKELARIKGISPELIENIYRIMIDFFINSEMREWESK